MVASAEIVAAAAAATDRPMAVALSRGENGEF
jgi:hypothetical protein